MFQMLISPGVKEAKIQLENRFKMIDAVLMLGFRRCGVYSGSIFVPALGNNQTSQLERRDIVLKRTPLRDYDYKVNDKSTQPSYPTMKEETHQYLLRLETPATLESF